MNLVTNWGGHLASTYVNANGATYGYHNQEEHHRRSEAFGLEVEQHDLKFHTLMSYQSYKSPSGGTKGCLDCRELNVFSSPDLWWFFDPVDPLHGMCVVVDESDSSAIQLVCEGPNAWAPGIGVTELNGEEAVFLSASEVIERAVPLGVSCPPTQPSDG